MASTTHIHEDRDTRWTRRSPTKSDRPKDHKRTPSVGAILRGRRLKENDPSKTEAGSPQRRSRERPLAERHINSPPQPLRIPLKDEDARPSMHKKTKSSVSLKSFMKGSKTDNGSGPSSDASREDHKPKKSKSSTNLGALLGKKSARNLKEEAAQQESNRGSSGPTTPLEPSENAKSPIWEQFTTQPFDDQFGKVQSPERGGRTIAQEIDLYTPKDQSGHRVPQQVELYGCHHPTLSEKPPQRPFLEHKSSRSSIFKEEGMDDESPTAHPTPNDGQPDSSYFDDQRPSMASRPTSTDEQIEINPKRNSRVMNAINALTTRNRDNQPSISPQKEQRSPISRQEIDAAFETVLDSRNIPHNMRDKMRSMDLRIKADFIKSHRVESGSSQASSCSPNEILRPSSRSPIKKDVSQSPKKTDTDPIESRRSRSRPRSRVFTLSKGDNSPSKKQKSTDDKEPRSRPRSIEIPRPGSSRSAISSSSVPSISSLGRPDSAAAPGDFIHYLHEVQKPELVEVGKLHKLRILLRNETVLWTDAFITEGGMDEIVSLLYRITNVEWREEHEDTLLHETLLCLKALCTTDLGLKRLTMIEGTLFPKMLSMLFDTERKGPSEFSTRAIFISTLFMHLSATTSSPGVDPEPRARTILSYLQDPTPVEEKKPLEFIQQMHIPRPYRVWCKEIVNVTKEVFWIFLHHSNVIPLVDKSTSAPPNTSYLTLYFPPPRPPHPAAPYVGGVEWEATLYLATHLDLLNGLIACLPEREQRNQLRRELRDSGFEKCMGGTMRTCKEKFYGHLHEGLRCWVAAAHVDGWEVRDVRDGPPREESSPRKKSPAKKKVEAAPKLDLKVGVEGEGGRGEDVWL